MLPAGRRTHQMVPCTSFVQLTIATARVLLILRGIALQPGQHFKIRSGLAATPPITYTMYYPLTDT